ncbi:unnamed protein product, partial [Cladocopium goreaui]
TNYEEALEKVKGMQYLTKPAFKEKETQLSKLETALGKVKKQLAKGDKGKVNITKDLLKEAVATMSEAKEEAKAQTNQPVQNDCFWLLVLLGVAGWWLAEQAMLDGCTHPEVCDVARAGSHGLYPGYVHRDLMARFVKGVFVPEPMQVPVQRLNPKSLKKEKEEAAVILPHMLFSSLATLPNFNEQGAKGEEGVEVEQATPLRKGKVMVDFHWTLEVDGKITPGNRSAMELLLEKGVEVVVCSWCFTHRRKEVLATLEKEDWFIKVTFISTTERTGAGGKASLCKQYGCTTIFEDGMDILKECHQQGIEVYCIRSPGKSYSWVSDQGLPLYASFSKAVSQEFQQNEDEYESWNNFLEKETQLSKLETALGKVKKQLAKGDKGKVNITKDLLKEAVATMSEAKEEAK